MKAKLVSRISYYALCAWLICGAAAAGAAPPTGNFFGRAEPAGELRVKLYPTEVVAAGSSQLVTFGMPFTRGSLKPADLRTVRILKPGDRSEIPAQVELLTPWRHASDAAIDGQFVRVARVQINYTFSIVYPQFEEVIVEWGRSVRTPDSGALQPVKNGWHTAASGSFVAPDMVQEPNVYAVLPPSYLSQGMLGTPVTPFDAAVGEARDDPLWSSSNQMNWPGHLLHQRAAKNFFYATINQDDPLATATNTWCNYKTDSEPWLYDRASAYYHLYFASGYPKALREAVRASQFYRSKLYPQGTSPAAAVGAFMLKVPNPAGYIGGNGAMYSYGENLAYSYWLMGDDSMLPSIRDVVTAHETHSESTRWRPDGRGYFTERHTAFKLRANVVAYEVFGDAQYKDNMLREYNDFIWHQNGAGGALPANRVDGGLWHTCTEHEGGPCTPDLLMASPWMSILTIESMLRAFTVTDDFAIADFIRRMGNFLMVSTKYNNRHWYNYSGNLYSPDYITLIDGSTDPGEGSQAEHSLEVATGIAWAHYFAVLTGKPNPALATRAGEVYTTYKWSVDNWTRPAAPSTARYTAYRVAPPRKYNWQYHPGLSFAFAVSGPGSSDAVKPAAPSNLRVGH